MTQDDDRIEGLDRLARARSPERDLWPGIASRLAPRRRARQPQIQFALAASVVMGLALAFALTLSRQPIGTGVDAGLSPGLALGRDRAIVKANLDIVQQSQHQLRDALRHSPDSAGLRELLANTERRERDLRALL